MDSTTLKAQIDSQITNETLPNSITPAEVGGNLKAVVDYIDQGEYSISLSQSGIAAPTADIVYKNTIGAIVWSRASAGVYFAILTGAFTVGKTKITPTNSYFKVGQRSIYATVSDVNTITLEVKDDAGNFADLNMTQATDLTIRVYP